MYDKGYEQLSKTYGTLLSSPMLREDNIMKRNEFFKLIDNDIKRISGLDLSLQQNVDSANKVFDSFFQNKDLVHDMTYTKEYNKQMEIGENYKNCTDKTCDGKYWDVGMNYLHYKADEFKKADKNSAMLMSPGKFIPQIDIQGKTIDYLKDLLGKGGEGGFGIESISYSKDGRYKITTKNGKQLAVPLQQVMQAVYGKDQRVADMYNAQAYVNRKGFVQQNAEKYGSEDLAEDAYFRALDVDYQNAHMQNQQAQDDQNKIRNRKKLLEETIKKYGSTGNDDLAKNYYAASVDDALSKDVADYHSQSADIAQSYFDASEDRATRRQRADALYARSLMTKEINESATRAAAMTGSVKVDADPYAMKHYEFSLDMKKLEKQYDLMDRNEQNKALYDLKKQKALIEWKKRGSAVGPENKPTFLANYRGTTDPTAVNEAAEMQQAYKASEESLEDASYAYSNGYANTLQSIIIDPKATAAEKNTAQDTLEKIYGAAKRDASGRYLSPGYDRTSGKYIDKYGNPYDTPNDLSPQYDAESLYKAVKAQAELHKGIPSHNTFINGEGKQLEHNYNTMKLSYDADSLQWTKNNKNVKDWGNTKISGSDIGKWNALFTSDHRIKTEDQYIKDYLNANPRESEDDARDAYKEMDKKYEQFYNEGNTTGKDNLGNPVPLVTAKSGTTAFGRLGGGRSAGGSLLFDFTSGTPSAMGNRALIGIYNDALNAGGMFTIGNKETKREAENILQKDKDLAKTAMTQLILDLKSGNLTKTEADYVKGQLAYMDIALSDRNTIGAHVIPPAGWLKQYKGTKDNPTWADDERLVTEGIGVYADKKVAKNDLTQSMKLQPYDHIIDNMNVPVTDPNGGDFVIHKRNSDGQIVVTGNFYQYTGQFDKNGQPIMESVPSAHTYNASVGGQILYNAINKSVAEAAKINEMYRQGNSKLIKNPSDLPEVQGMQSELESDGSNNVNDLFARSVQQALYGK